MKIINLISSINYNPKIIIASIVLIAIWYNLATFDYVEWKRQATLNEAKADQQDLKEDAKEKQKELENILSAINKADKCIEWNSNTWVLLDCDTLSGSLVEVKSELGNANYPSEINNKEKRLIEEEKKIESSKKEEFRWAYLPEQLFYTTKKEDKCWVSQTEQSHFTKAWWYMLATDVACSFWKAEVYAPDYLDKAITYTIKKKTNDLLWDYVELYWDNKKWILWHTTTRLKDWDVIYTGERLWQMNLTWYTTWYHTHIELWHLIDGKWKNISYTTRSEVLENKRNNVLQSWKNWDTIYLTSYHLWDVNQNDEAPYIWASWKDLRNVSNPIALTIDVRKIEIVFLCKYQ